jgi:hypothetical protein
VDGGIFFNRGEFIYQDAELLLTIRHYESKIIYSHNFTYINEYKLLQEAANKGNIL